MKKYVLILLLMITPLLCLGRGIKVWSYQELFDQADLVVIGVPVSNQDTKETNGPAGWDTIGVNTEFKLSVVMKGDTKIEKLVLHHYRLKERKQLSALMNGPGFVEFKQPFIPELSERYLLFLKRESDGRYAPVSGQMDPAMIDVIKLQGTAR